MVRIGVGVSCQLVLVELPFGCLHGELLERVGVEQPRRVAIKRLAHDGRDVLLEHAANGLLHHRAGASQPVGLGDGRAVAHAGVVHELSWTGWGT